MDRKLRKTMIVSSWAPPAIGGPQNMYNLFCLFPQDSYCILTSYYGIDNYSAQNGTWLPGKYIFYDNTSLVDTPENRKRNTEASSGRTMFSNLKHRMKQSKALKTILGPFVIFSQVFMITRRGRKALREENIDVIFGVSDYGPALLSTYLLHKLTKKPYILHLYDIYWKNALPWPGNLLAHFFEKPLLENAELVIVTNDGTKRFYQNRYPHSPITYEAIYNAVFGAPYMPLRTPYNPQPPYEILFTGRIYWPQIGSLKNLIEAAKELRDLNVRLVFYTPQPPEHVHALGLKSDQLTFNSAPPTEMPNVQSKADILFLPLSWRTESPEIIATATPGKLSDYLIAGRPILIHAPAWTALAQYAKEDGFAEVVDHDDVQLLAQAIRKLLTDKAYGQRLTDKGKETFLKNHEARNNAERLKEILSAAKQ